MAEAPGIAGPSQSYSVGAEDYSDERFISFMGQLWELKINPQEFSQMKPEIVQQIYLAFLSDIGVDLEKFHQIPHKFLETCNSPEDYTGSLRLLALSSHMRKYLKLIYNDESFRLADVFNPKPKRTRRYFGMIYKFLVHCEDYFEELEKIENEVHTIIERRDKTKARIHKLKQLITERKADNTKNEVAKEAEKKRLEEKTKELQECQEKKLFLKGQLDSLNLSLAGLSTTRKEMELWIMESKEEKQRLEGLVIQTTEEEEIKKKDDKLTLLKTENQARRDHMAKLQEKLKAVISHKEKIEKYISVLHDIELEKSKERDLQANIEQKNSQISHLHEDIRNQDDQTLQLTQQLTSSENKLQNMKQTWELKKKSFDDQIKEQKQVLEDLNRNHNEQDIAYKDMMDTIAGLEEQIKESKERINSKNTLMKNNYRMILDMVEEENVDLYKILQEVAESVEEFKRLAE